MKRSEIKLIHITRFLPTSETFSSGTCLLILTEMYLMGKNTINPSMCCCHVSNYKNVRRVLMITAFLKTISDKQTPTDVNVNLHTVVPRILPKKYVFNIIECLFKIRWDWNLYTVYFSLSSSALMSKSL